MATDNRQPPQLRSQQLHSIGTVGGGVRNRTCASAALTAVVALAARLGCGASGAETPGTVTYTWQEMPQMRHGRASGAMPGPDVATCPADVHRCSCRASCCTCTAEIGRVSRRTRG